MNLRALLRAQGVSGRELDEAVAKARDATRWAGLGAEMVAMGLVQASQRLQSERARGIALRAAHVATKVKEGADVMLRTKKAPKEAKAEPARRLPRPIQVEIVSKR